MTSAMEALKAAGIRPTAARVAVLENLQARCDHPTVDTLYRDLSPQRPALSRTTVYDALYRMAEGGLVRALTLDPAEVRFDAGMHAHAHFRCTGCGQVVDIPMAEASAPPMPEGYVISHEEIYYSGLCASCAAKAE